MITTAIHRVGESYRIKFIGHCLSSGSRTEGYFTANELAELRMAVERAQARIHEMNTESGDIQCADELFARYQEQFRQMLPAADSAP